MELWSLRLGEGLHFHGGTGLARRSVVATAWQCHRELNHGETKKGDPLWGLKQRCPSGRFMVVWGVVSW